MHRIIDIEYNKFPTKPSSKLLDDKTDGYLNHLEINLVTLAATFNIEEFRDNTIPRSYLDYPALRYLIPNTDIFKFVGGHPGSNKDSKKENSRVLGQCISRYFINEFLEAPYVANVSDFLGKQLNSNFNNLNIERKSSGDTPDFISAKNNSTIFLTEAKGRRQLIKFEEKDFSIWREQFDRISIKNGKQEISLKGYIIACCIANEENKINNSKLLVEDPHTTGAPFENDANLFNLIKSGHYKNVLSKMNLGFIGESLIYINKLPEYQFRIPVFTSKALNKEYIGVFSSNMLNSSFIYPFIEEPEFYNYIKFNSQFFYGIEKNTFNDLMITARGNYDNLTNIKLQQKESFFNESSIEFRDGTIFSDAHLITFKQSERF